MTKHKITSPSNIYINPVSKGSQYGYYNKGFPYIRQKWSRKHFNMFRRPAMSRFSLQGDFILEITMHTNIMKTATSIEIAKERYQRSCNFFYRTLWGFNSALFWPLSHIFHVILIEYPRVDVTVFLYDYRLITCSLREIFGYDVYFT